MSDFNAFQSDESGVLDAVEAIVGEKVPHDIRRACERPRELQEQIKRLRGREIPLSTDLARRLNQEDVDLDALVGDLHNDSLDAFARNRTRTYLIEARGFSQQLSASALRSWGRNAGVAMLQSKHAEVAAEYASVLRNHPEISSLDKSSAFDAPPAQQKAYRTWSELASQLGTIENAATRLRGLDDETEADRPELFWSGLGEEIRQRIRRYAGRSGGPTFNDVLLSGPDVVRLCPTMDELREIKTAADAANSEKRELAMAKSGFHYGFGF